MSASAPTLSQHNVSHSEADAALRALFASKPFRGSPQSQRMLAYIVEHAMAGHDDLLRERMIGAAVFGRSLDYDAANDPVVRGRAADMRKRLALYYSSEESASCPLIIEIPPGSYRARFHRRLPEPAPQAEAARRPGLVRGIPGRWLLSWKLVLPLALAVVCAVAAWRHMRSPDGFERFWAPLFDSSKPVNIYQACNTTYTFRAPLFTGYNPPGWIAAPSRAQPGPTIAARDLVPITDQFITVGDSYLSSELCVLSARHNKLYHLRYGNDISYGEIRYSPTILIGAFNNDWTLKTTADLPLIFEGLPPSVSERGGRHRVWTLPDMDIAGHTSEDYALVSRMIDGRTGQVLISAAGITQYGTRAAAEFLTVPVYLRAALGGAPKSWSGANCEFLLHTKILGGETGPPQVVTSRFW